MQHPATNGARAGRWVGLLAAALLLLAGLVATPARAQTTPPPNAAAAQDQRLDDFIALGTKFRIVGIRDAGRLNEFLALPKQSPFPFDLLGGGDPNLRQRLWSLFFRQSQVYLGNGRSPAPVLGFYSPIVDYWLLTYWRQGGESWSLEETVLLPGEFLREPGRGNGGLQAVPDWLRALQASSSSNPLTVRDALQELTAYSVLSFLRLSPMEGATDTRPDRPRTNASLIQATFANRLLGGFGLIRDSFARKGVAPLYRSFRAAVEKGDRQGIVTLGAQPGDPAELADAARILAGTPPAIRAAMQPVLAMPLGSSVLVLSAAESNARWMTVALIEQGEDAPRLGGVSLYDLYARVHGP